MKILRPFIMLAFVLSFFVSSAQGPGPRGFDYRAHQRLNHKAQRWSDHRMKAAGHNLVNVRCNASGSRRAARKNRK